MIEQMAINTCARDHPEMLTWRADIEMTICQAPACRRKRRRTQVVDDRYDRD
jgi:hypothetical protein